MVNQRLAARSAFVATIALVSCSGGGGSPVQPIRGTGTIPTATPTAAPTSTPTASATGTPTAKPSATPTATPTAKPSAAPTATPTATPVPTATPTSVPTTNACARPLPAGPSIFYAASNNPPTITVYAGDFTGSSTPSLVLQPGVYSNGQETGLEQPFSVALGANGNVYTLETQGALSTTASVAEYLPNFNCMGPVSTLNGIPFGGSTPGGVAVDAAGYVYVASQVPRQLALYAPLVPGAQASQPLATIAIPSVDAPYPNLAENDPIGIALDASGRIYIANGADKSILVYPARSGGTLSATTSATIAGSLTTFDTYAVDVAVDASGKIYVVDDDFAVKVYAANPSSQTQIDYVPVSVAVDHLGVIYVGDYQTPSQSAILEFPANPTGTVNEAPQGILTGTNPTGLVAK